MTTTLRRLLEDLRHIDRAGLATGTALRCAIGVALPLVIGLLAGHPAGGVAAAAGALSVGIASFQGVYRTRLVAVVITSIGMAISTFVGAVANHPGWLTVLVAAAWAFGAGMLVSIGPGATAVALQWTVALLVVSQFQMSAEASAARAGLVLAGGLAQALLVVALWPLRSHRQERLALAASYRSLAGYARGVADGGDRLPDTDSLATVSRALSDPNPLARDDTHLRFRLLLTEAERIRVELTALADARHRLSPSPPRDVLDALLATASGTLTRVADALDPTRGNAATSTLRAEQTGTEPGGTQLGDDAFEPDVLAGIEALLGQLRSVVHIVRGIDGHADLGRIGERFPNEPAAARRPALAIRGPLITLRANLNLESETFRHAIRLAVTVGVAAALYRLLPVERGYWVPLTVLVVLRPDFASTLSRGFGRIIGTAIGAVLATVIAVVLAPPPAVLIALAAAVAFGAYSLFRVNLTAYASLLTALVVFLLAIIGLPAQTAIVDRLVDTVVGGALAMFAYAIWPTWERAVVATKLARLLEAQCRYGSLVLTAYSGAVGAAVLPPRDRSAIRAAQLAARRARSNAQASIARLAAEPTTLGMRSDLAGGIVADIARYAQAILTLHARLPEDGAPALGALRPLVDQLDVAMHACAIALRTGRTRVQMPPLRSTQLALARSLDESDPVARILLVETDLVVDAIDDLAHLLANSVNSADTATTVTVPATVR